MTPLRAVLAAGLAMNTLAGAAVLSADYVIVDVRPGDPDAPSRIWVPVPLRLARIAAAFVPAGHRRLEICDEARRHLPAARAMLAEIKRLPDAELVRVEDRGETVTVGKAGDRIRVEVRSPREQVEVSLPLAMAEQVLAALERPDAGPADMLAALAASPSGDLVHVRDGKTEVRVALW